MITGIPVPLEADSELLLDARFGCLCFGQPGIATSDGQDSSRAAQAFIAMVKAKTDQATLVAEAIDLLNRQFTKSLGLNEPMESAQPLSVYGLESLSAVELRNWIRIQLGSEITTLEILSATSLVTLCEKVVMKMKQE